MGWDRMRWDGFGCDGMGYNGMARDGIGWGMGWDFSPAKDVDVEADDVANLGGVRR